MIRRVGWFGLLLQYDVRSFVRSFVRSASSLSSLSITPVVARDKQSTSCAAVAKRWARVQRRCADVIRQRAPAWNERAHPACAGYSVVAKYHACPAMMPENLAWNRLP